MPKGSIGPIKNGDIMTSIEVSEILEISRNTLRYWRAHGTGPRSFILRGKICYLRSDVEKWLHGRIYGDEGQRNTQEAV